MPWLLRAYLAAFERQMPPFVRRLGSLATVSLLAGFAQGCTGTPAPPFAGPDPSDPTVRTRAVGHQSTTAPYASRRPVEPTPWREQNERVAPPAKPAE
jgi:hypothetical protein